MNWTKLISVGPEPEVFGSILSSSVLDKSFPSKTEIKTYVLINIPNKYLMLWEIAIFVS